MIRLHTAEDAGFEVEAYKGMDGERRFDAAYAVRMISDLSPNPFVARDVIRRVVDRLRVGGFDDALIGRLSGFIIDELRKALGLWRDEQSACLFRERLASGEIEFRLRGDDGDWIMPSEVWTTVEENAVQLNGKTGGQLERSLFLPIYAADLNDAERNVAIYLDDEAAIRWWHRNGTDRGGYGLRGWRRGNVYPDFVFAALKDGAGERIVALESKGDQLAGNLDSEYKRDLLATLTAAYPTGGGDGGGSLALGRGAVDFEAALVLFSDAKARLPGLIRGGAGPLA